MFSRIAILLPIFVLPTMLVAAETFSSGQPAIAWTAEQVSRTAAANSTSANLLDSERSAVLASISRDDPKQCAQAALLQNVQRNFVCYERSRSAAQALTLYYQLIHLESQQRLLDDADQTLSQLLRMADKADELGLKDGNQSALDKRRLQVHDQRAEADGGNAKLRIGLGELLGRPFHQMVDAEFVDAASDDIRQSFSVDQWIAIALSDRCDIKAIETLCSSLNENSLPAARQLLGSLQPGLGLAIALASRQPLLASLHSDDRAAAELCHRREQCARLLAARRAQVESQVRIAFIDHQTALSRLDIARQIAEIDLQQTAQSLKAIELDQAKPGAELLAKLEHLQTQGQVLERQSARAVAYVKLLEAAGAIIGQ